MFYKSILGAICACLAVVSFNVNAAIIGPDGFGGNEFVQTYDGDIGLIPDNNYHTSVVIDGDTYITGTLRLTDRRECVSGLCLDIDNDDLTIILETPSHRVGVYTFQSATPCNLCRTIATYYDSDGAIIDSSTVSGPPGNHFFGYESLDNPIAKVSYEFIYGAFSATSIDNFTTETVVPIPPAIWLFSSGLLGLIGLARRKS